MDAALAFLTEHGISLITLAIVLATVLKQPLQNLFQSKVERSEKRSAWELETEKRMLDRVLTNGPRADSLMDRMILIQSANAVAVREQAEKTERVVSTAISVMQDYAGVAASTLRQQEAQQKERREHQERYEQLMKEVLIVMNRISQRLA
jgi:hypothetical protein